LGKACFEVSVRSIRWAAIAAVVSAAGVADCGGGDDIGAGEAVAQRARRQV
jgi:hypothetical protein